MKKNALTLSLFLALAFVMFIALTAQMQAEEMVKCPVSGKEVKKSEAKESYEYEGKTYYFSCEGCKEKFMKEPEKYIKKKEEMTHKAHEQKEMHEHKEIHKHKEMKMYKEDEKAYCAMSGLLHSEDVKMNIENLENGISVKITSENPEVVKKLHEISPHMKAMHEKMGSCSKEEAKKKEVKK